VFLDWKVDSDEDEAGRVYRNEVCQAITANGNLAIWLFRKN
jgi:hypothetical protein